MLKENPDLRGASRNPLVKRHFSTLHRFNPEYASDPNVAGAYVRQNIAMATDDINAIHSLVKARKDVRDARSLRPFATFDTPKMT